MKIDFQVSSPVSQSARVKQLSAMFDCPVSEVSKLNFKGELPIEEFDWNVGLIVGPSGCGKSTILNHAFGAPQVFDWAASSVIDDFSRDLSMQTISEVCQSVGFNTIPAWMRPYAVLSNGEKFRVEMARHLLSGADPILMDEFTSVVDRQVAQIGSHAVQKYVRKNNLHFVASTCHYDVLDWLQPDWILEPATMSFQRRSLRRRPDLEVEIRRVEYAYWKIFAPFHYLSADLNPAAQCFVLFVNDQPASFAGMLHFPHPSVRDIKRCSRLVTLPDWQGLGLALILVEQMGAAYRAVGNRLRTYPAHPSLIRSFAKSSGWACVKKPGNYSPRKGDSSSVDGFGGRPCAVFEYKGEGMDATTAKRLLA
jgi:hypothetical protein